MSNNTTKNLKGKSGIYKITIRGKIYIGSSKNLLKRLYDHRSSLNTNRHINIYLQRLFNKYKELDFEVIEFCEPEERLVREEYYISTIENVNYIKNPTTSTKEVLGKKVQKIDIYGRIIKTYHSIDELSIELSVNPNSISEAIRLRGQYSRNLYFYTEAGKPFHFKSLGKRIILLLDISNNIIKIFPTGTQAQLELSGGKDSLRWYIDKPLLFDKKYYLKTLKEFLKIND